MKKASCTQPDVPGSLAAAIVIAEQRIDRDEEYQHDRADELSEPLRHGASAA